ncbi:peptidase M23 [Lamprobacter modestohalophilus]|uniref:Peptidase M23 n=1 Tax=Lamprobacter modestohalophilus TaxID=1064514 RepID=A0A9X0W554_9GAMM|nr:M23 family metallopeptidase [Lamprobacter modestohalophilus]MCF7979794.1 M23 family metallopeptidase [Chromatiaceae bacterium]MBK1616971.1 peptidase M23 [Lamprobacter modestohalophilus]MCF7993997.1 M23 family metallopeptidase [Chromatiaceae bacterium]MCF8004433.1 M23 family metallopeptidase [Chromatiaceae bacterium]MCF8017651.1 M23 family metallopeptidase [Chromatiaceae bacterium]
MRRLNDSDSQFGYSSTGLLTLMLVALLAGASGFWLGHHRFSAQTHTDLATVLSHLNNRHRVSGAPTQDADAELDSIAIRVGQLQAEVLRINALGQRLVEMSGLDVDEFNFLQPAPSGGGPEKVNLRENKVDEVAQDLAKVLAELGDRKRKLVLLETLIMERDLKSHTIPDGWPLTTGGVVTSTFGMRRHPISGRRSMHKGIDISGKHGSDIVAMADGLVIFSGRKTGYGKIVEIRHPDGLETRYAHNSSNIVNKGDLVTKGQVIAKLGSTGRSTGPHVHFEVRRDGEALDPMRFLDLSERSRLARL